MLRTWVGDERRIRDGDDEKMKEVAYMSMLRLSGWSAVTPFLVSFLYLTFVYFRFYIPILFVFSVSFSSRLPTTFNWAAAFFS